MRKLGTEELDLADSFHAGSIEYVSSHPRDAAQLPLAEFRDRYARGGYWWTMRVNQTMGAVLAQAAIRFDLRPVHLSLMNVALGVATSAWVLLLRSRPVIAALIAVIGWSIAYSLDCADGQLARATQMSTAGGAILDLLGDYLVQITVIFSMLQVSTSGMDPTWVTAFAVFVTGGWLISPYYSGILGAGELPSAGKMRSLRGIVRQLRDYGVHVTVLPVAAIFGPAPVATLLALIALLNFVALFLGIGTNGRKGF